MSVTRINYFRAATGKTEALSEFLNSLVPYIEQSSGCLSCQVLQSDDESTEFVIIEQWQTKEDHQRSVTNFPQDEMRDAMILFAESPRGVYYHNEC